MDPSNDLLRKAMGMIASLFTSIPDGPKLFYASFKATIESNLKSYEEKSMFYDSTIQMNVDGLYNYKHPLSFAAKQQVMKSITFMKQ